MELELKYLSSDKTQFNNRKRHFAIIEPRNVTTFFLKYFVLSEHSFVVWDRNSNYI